MSKETYTMTALHYSLIAICAAALPISAGQPLLKTADWQSLPLPTPPAPKTITAIPFLTDLPTDVDAMVQQIRSEGVSFEFVTYPNGGPPKLPSTGALCFTQTHVVAVLEGRQTPGYELLEHAFPKEDAHIWGDDNFEIFVDPFLSRTDYIHFIVNPRGDVFDQRCLIKRVPDPKAADPSDTITKTVQDATYNSGATVPVMKEQDRWAAVFQLPYTAFGLEAPPVGQVWGLNVCHTNRENAELSQWQATPGGRGFHQPLLFRALRFGKQVSGPKGVISLAHLGGGGNRAVAEVNNPHRAATVTWTAALTDTDGETISRATGVFAAPTGNSTHGVDFRAPFSLRGRCRIAIELSTEGKTFAYSVRNVDVGPTISLAIPLDQIYTTDSTILGTLRLELGELALGGMGTPIVLELAGGSLSRTSRFTRPQGNILQLGLNPQGLPPGNYTLRATYGNIASCEQRFTVIPAPFDF